ncbi:MAG: YHS domain-containing protein [Bacteroidetes bacterium]|nr:YHS domain-containing protein [Bacteroidota bacterium]
MPAVRPAGTADITAADPVCGMPVDSSWTDSTVYQNYTLRFCSEGCKRAFLARPAKYLKPTNNKQ